MKYYTEKLNEIAKETVKKCEVCAQVKTQNRQFRTLGSIKPAMAPFEILHIDTKSGFKVYGTTKKHLHLAIDAYMRFTWAVALKTKVAQDFIHLIQNVMTVQKPRLIVADNYPAITSKAFRAFLHKNDIAIVFTSANHPASNGIVERVNQTLVQKLKCKRLDERKVS